jgi:UDP-glucose 4-epimerase
MVDNLSSPLKEFREVNIYGTLNLAKQAAFAGVKRFILSARLK